MKKLIYFFVAVIIIVCSISYLYIMYKSNENTVAQQNQLFESYYQRQVYGAEVATAINKAMDSNYRNNVEKDKNNLYIENTTNSIKISIKMIDNDEIYPMEVFAKSGIQTFLEYYNNIQFKCVDIQHHENTKLVKSLLFEQMTIS